MAKKEVSAIVRGADLLTSIFSALDAAVRERGGTDEDIHRLATPQGKKIIARMADIIVRQAGEVFPITVDYALSLEQMITAGNYDWKNSDINPDHFPIKGCGQVEVETVLVHLNRIASTDEVLEELGRRGLRSATLPELLAFGARYPDKQREFSIIELGSVWTDPDGDRCVACFYGSVDERRLRLRWFGSRWRGHYRFLAVRK
ncbi:hypothetical protein KKD19_03685 [Patescibacteria group bacterium]|nr:hypothetical protein [Patescibacteria group bacterium]MBU4512314.1 hypothetical protein [Patescibacteria group bacterium]